MNMVGIELTGIHQNNEYTGNVDLPSRFHAALLDKKSLQWNKTQTLLMLEQEKDSLGCRENGKKAKAFCLDAFFMKWDRISY